MTRPEDKSGDVSGYSREVRSEKVRAVPIQPVKLTEAERRANDRFYDPTHGPLTSEEKAVLWKWVAGVVAVVAVVVIVWRAL